MFQRKSFITNSSSTSFIAYGIKLPSYQAPKDDEDGDSLSWEEYYIECGGPRWNDNPPVELYSNYDADEAVMYVKASEQDIEWGYNPLKAPVKGDDWDDKIREACELMGINASEPGWFGWYNGNC